MLRISLVLLALTLAACQQQAATPNASINADASAAPASALEQAARDSGLVADVARVSPVGLYQQRHEAGRNSLCVLPGTDGRYRFGVEAVFGAEESCRGTGIARRAGDKLILRFSGRSQCTIVVQYEGDRVAMPGVVDVACAKLCDANGSFEGVSFPRIAADEQAAKTVRDRNENALCEG
ncbi:hypothetical protein [Sphingobium aromaticiconvertens]|uniref:hypothetical protein n=1 Tax=Sphingobium aromaticiconvertens TaxID=365341 RepID=UPI003019A14C